MHDTQTARSVTRDPHRRKMTLIGFVILSSLVQGVIVMVALNTDPEPTTVSQQLDVHVEPSLESGDAGTGIDDSVTSDQQKPLNEMDSHQKKRSNRDGSLTSMLVVGGILGSMFMVAPLVAFKLKANSRKSRDYWTDELDALYSPENFTMARMTSNQLVAFDMDDKVIATSRSLLSKRGRDIEVSGRGYRVLFERDYVHRQGFLESSVYSTISKVFAKDALDSEPLVVFRAAYDHTQSHYIETPGLPTAEVRPSPAKRFPDRFDILIDDEVVGCVVQAGKIAVHGVYVVMPDVPDSYRSLIALLCHYNLTGH